MCVDVGHLLVVILMALWGHYICRMFQITDRKFIASNRLNLFHINLSESFADSLAGSFIIFKNHARLKLASKTSHESNYHLHQCMLPLLMFPQRHCFDQFDSWFSDDGCIIFTCSGLCMK